MRLSAFTTFLPLASATAHWAGATGKDIKYSTLEGYFMQDDPETDPESFDYASWNLGLLNRTYLTDTVYDPDNTKTQWQRFAYWVSYLNEQCATNDRVRYKLLVMGRHGQGWHNVAESYYGTPAWNCYWAELEGNGTITWSDPHLTPTGISEAAKANAFYASRFAEQHMPFFERYYVSPFTRCIQTAYTTFSGLDLPITHPFAPIVKEGFREGISIHTCDRRSSKSYIAGLEPDLRFEAGFTEDDELWRGEEGETPEHQQERSKAVLDDVFVNDSAVWVSVTSHSGEITQLLTVLGHRPFKLGTGQIIPVLVKAELVDPEPTSTFASWTSEATCAEPPVTSVSGKGCVCSGSSTLGFVDATATAAAEI